MDLINRQMVMDAVYRLSLGETDAAKLFMKIYEYLKRVPSAQPDRKTGKWIDEKGNPVGWEKIGDDKYPLGWCYCSVCGESLIASDEYPVFGYFCPNCGADMRGNEDE